MWKKLQVYLVVSATILPGFKSPILISSRTVDALMVGAHDLRFALGLQAGSVDGDEPSFVSALARIQRAANANGLAVLGFTYTPEILEKRLKLGWRALVTHTDVTGILSSGLQNLKECQETAKNSKVGALLNGNGNTNGHLK